MFQVVGVVFDHNLSMDLGLVKRPYTLTFFGANVLNARVRKGLYRVVFAPSACTYK